MSKKYTPIEVAVIVLQKAEELTKSAMAGLKTAKLTPIPGVVSPANSNTGTPGKVGSQAVVKSPKAKKMGSALDKPSVFFKSEDGKKTTIENLRDFLDNHRAKHKL